MFKYIIRYKRYCLSDATLKGTAIWCYMAFFLKIFWTLLFWHCKASPAPAPEAKLPEGRPGTPLQPTAPTESPPEEESTEPAVMHVGTMTRAEKEKVKRICTPKATTGNLEVPKDVFELWQTAKGKDKLFAMWCKSGGVKDWGLPPPMFQHVPNLSLKKGPKQSTISLFDHSLRSSSCSVLRFSLQQLSRKRLKCMVASIPKLTWRTSCTTHRLQAANNFLVEVVHDRF